MPISVAQSTMMSSSPEYPLPSHCWLCGRFAHGGRTYAMRWCDRCDCRWNERLPGVYHEDKPLDLPGIGLLLGPRWNFRPSQKYADQFDRCVDHSAVHIPCPA